MALVETFIDAVAVEMRATRAGRYRPWELVAEAAAFCHSIEYDPLRSLVPYWETCRGQGVFLRGREMIFHDFYCDD
jgi:hypothetical protein